MKKTFSYIMAGLMVLLLGVAVAPAQAADFRLPDEQNRGQILIPASETYGNLYTVASNVNINGTINGDLYVAGGNVTLDSPIGGDMVVAGGTVLINSEVRGDIRILGGTITVNAPVAGDIVGLGGTIQLSNKANVGGDVAVSGGSITINSNVQGKVSINGGTILINGTVNGNVKITADDLTFGPSSVITQPVVYQGIREANIQSGAQVGDVQFTERSVNQKNDNAGAILGSLFGILFFWKLIIVLITALVLYWLMPRRFTENVMHAVASPWSNMGIGFLFLVVVPIASILLAITTIGIYLALIIMTVYILLLMLSGVLGAVLSGWYFFRYNLIKRGEPMTLDWKVIVSGVIIFSILSIIPIVGWLVTFGLMLIGLGSLVSKTYYTLREEKIEPIKIA